MKGTAKILLCLSTMTPLAVHAQIIMCKDAAGKTYTSDRPIMECSGRAYREFGKNGNLKREVAAPLTAEQKRQMELEEQRRKAEEAALAEQKQADRAMLTRYLNEGDIGLARKRALEVAGEQRQRHAEALAAAEKRLKQAQLEITQVKNKNDMPPGLQRRIEEADKAIRDERKNLQESDHEIAQINKKYDATLQRYRELAGRQSTASK